MILTLMAAFSIGGVSVGDLAPTELIEKSMTAPKPEEHGRLDANRPVIVAPGQSS